MMKFFPTPTNTKNSTLQQARRRNLSFPFLALLAQFIQVLRQYHISETPVPVGWYWSFTYVVLGVCVKLIVILSRLRS